MIERRPIPITCPKDLSILSTDYFPSKEETPGILTTYNHQIEILRELESEIMSLATRIKDLQKTRDLVLKLVNGNASLIAPIRKLSDKLLTRIFQYLPVYPSFVVTSVCKRWRAAAIATPSLWTDIRHGQTFLLDFPKLYRSFYTRLDNTFDEPLDLTIDTRHNENASQFHFQPHRLLSISQMARNQLHRCRSLALHGFHGAKYLLLSHMRPPPLRKLRYLFIDFQSGTLESSTVFTLELPWLDELKLVNPGNLLQHIRVPAGLRRLRSLTLHQCEPQDLEILPQCPNIVQLTILFSFTGTQQHLILPSHISLPRLTEISISQGIYQGVYLETKNDAIVSDFLSRIVSPSLTKLTTALTRACTQRALPDFPSHPERLQVLRIEYLSECYYGGGDFSESEAYYRSIWAVFPNIHTLILSTPFFCTVFPGFVWSLLPQKNQLVTEWPCPKLRTLTLAGLIVHSEITQIFYLRTDSVLQQPLSAYFHFCYAKRSVVDALKVVAEDLDMIMRGLNRFHILPNFSDFEKCITYPFHLIDMNSDEAKSNE